MPDSVAHHFVPQHLQRNFANDLGGMVSVIDVKTGRKFSTGTSVLMQQGHFHTIGGSDRTTNFEDDVTAIERQMLRTLTDVVENKRLAQTDEETLNLARLVVFQELRTSAFRDRLVRLGEELRTHAANLGATPEAVEEWLPHDDSMIKATHLMFMFEQLEGLAQVLVPRTFLLAKPPAGSTLYLGDSPIARHSRETQSLFGGLGLASRDLQLHMPLAKDLRLEIWNPEILRSIKEKQAIGRRLKAEITLSPSVQEHLYQNPIESEDVQKAMNRTAKTRALIESIEAGSPIELEPENVEFCNSQQMAMAQRHVICPYDNYDLAVRWLAENSTR